MEQFKIQFEDLGTSPVNFVLANQIGLNRAYVLGLLLKYKDFAIKNNHLREDGWFRYQLSDVALTTRICFTEIKDIINDLLELKFIKIKQVGKHNFFMFVDEKVILEFTEYIFKGYRHMRWDSFLNKTQNKIV